MPEQLATLLYLLSEFTGTGGGPQHAIVHYTIQAFLWGALVVIARVKRKVRPEPHETLLIWGFSFGLARELVMITVKVLEAFKVVSHDHLHVVFPPLEHALSNIAVVVVSGAFIFYLTSSKTLARRYLKVSVTAVVLVYLATFWWWGAFILANPTAKFGQTWCDWLFRINACVWLALPLGYLLYSAKGWARNVVCFSLSMFFLNEFLKLPDMALGERYEYVFAPIRHALTMIAIPPLGYVFLKSMSLSLRESFDTLEDRVRDRTRELQQTMDQLNFANQQLLEISFIDGLTKVKNRRFFDEAYATEWRRSFREKTPLALLMADLDHFKQVNDTYGHPFGDVCLLRVAEAISGVSKRSTDLVARYGGEEFIVLLPNTTQREALKLGEAVRAAIASLQVQAPDGEVVQITISIGVAATVPQESEVSSHLIEQADQALYKAKQNGRDQVCSANNTKLYLAKPAPPDAS